MEDNTNEERCGNKKIFVGREEALQRLQEIQQEVMALPPEERGKWPIRAYRCADCRQWHLTAIPRQKWKKIKRNKKRKLDPEKDRFYREVGYWLDRLGPAPEE